MIYAILPLLLVLFCLDCLDKLQWIVLICCHGTIFNFYTIILKPYINTLIQIDFKWGIDEKK